MENWKIVGFNGYEISDKGRLRNRGKYIQGSMDRDGYIVHNLQYRGIVKHIKYHRLVAIAFLPNPENKPQINHKNGIKSDNRLENLEWVSGKENMKHSFDVLGRKNIGKAVIQCDIEGNVICEFSCLMDIERSKGFCHSYISRVCLGRYKTAYGYIWKYKK